MHTTRRPATRITSMKISHAIGRCRLAIFRPPPRSGCRWIGAWSSRSSRSKRRNRESTSKTMATSLRSARAFVVIVGLLAIAPFLLHASTVSAARPQQAPDRNVAPKPGPPPALKLPAIQKRTLSNGLPVWIVELHKVPVAQVSLVVKSGSGADPKGKYGLANLTADMLDEGAGSAAALKLEDAIEYLGASLSTSSTSDASSIELHVPVARLGDALPIMADVAPRPTFPDKELQRVREELLTSILEAEDDPATLVQFAFPRLVFGPKHRYGTVLVGTAAVVKGLTIADMKQFHTQRYVPASSAIIVTG